MMSKAMDLFKLDGKVAVVTGGGRGLGFFAAEGLAEAGADIAICGRGVGGDLDKAAEKIRATGRKCIPIKCDVAEEKDVLEMAEKVKNRFGKCDILVNNAGIAGTMPTEQFTSEDWTRMMDVNLKGTFQCCREIGKLMIAQSSGSIINLSSENGQVGFSVGMTAYATSKIGLVGLSRSLAVEWGKHNIRVNTLLPGNMQEGMMEDLKDKESEFYQYAGEPFLNLIPLTRFGNGDDIKGAIVFLASQAGGYLSGAKLVLDGGFTINSGL
ncbi:MAG: SDR family oxidoreductase [Deltaproteobacteria bacterium]|nr:SDR family oxidoreductase [Deltaproteobacteria bacterium]MBT4639735.1 SDR family oxidoreductase [Deltaproteobacteria bacterium]MBT6503792.1 SDR family oxidoreductase [Deltaproteobacteria bacterium]MBT7716676.1 SDR family oxidoreductase [Deltaproteobacteria bacterium]